MQENRGARDMLPYILTPSSMPLSCCRLYRKPIHSFPRTLKHGTTLWSVTLVAADRFRAICDFDIGHNKHLRHDPERREQNLALPMLCWYMNPGAPIFARGQKRFRPSKIIGYDNAERTRSNPKILELFPFCGYD